MKVIGPIDISGVAKEYVNSCINHALNDSKSVYILQGIIALVADIYGGGGTVSAANLYAYVEHVKTTAIACLTDSGRIEAYLRDFIADKFSATVKEESHWVYWNL